MYFTTLTLLGVLAVPVQLAAQEKQDHPHQYHHYKLIDMGTFGGPQSYSAYPDSTSEADVNSQGALTGWADTKTPDPFPNFCFDEDCFVAHAFQWQNGVRSDLGVLPGGASSGSTVISKSGLIAGVSENGEIDPLIPGFPELRAVLWTDGKIRDLGVLPEGGYESLATAVNSSGLVAGLATNTTPDAYSMLGTGYQTRAFVWDKREGMQDLGALPGGTDAQALLMNERGQVAGQSYTSSAPSAVCPPLTTGSFIWDKKNGMVNLGNFGGTCTEAVGLNNRGRVVGFSYLTGDQVVHAFLWDRATGLVDLGTLGGQDYAVAAAINDSGDAVGGSYLPGNVLIDAALWGKDGITDLGGLAGGCGAFAFWINNSRQVVGNAFNDCTYATTTGFLWEDGGPMVDLNTLIVPGSGIFVPIGITINDRGEIAAQGVLPNGDERAVLLIPCDGNHPNIAGCDYSLVDAAEAAKPNVVRPQMALPSAGRPRGMRRPFLGPMRRSPSMSVRGAGEHFAPTASGGEAGSEISSCRAGERASASGDEVGLVVHGACSVNISTNTLTGVCQGPLLFSHTCAGKHDTSQCPTGQRALEPEYVTCGNFGPFREDLKRPCQFIFE